MGSARGASEVDSARGAVATRKWAIACRTSAPAATVGGQGSERRSGGRGKAVDAPAGNAVCVVTRRNVLWCESGVCVAGTESPCRTAGIVKLYCTAVSRTSRSVKAAN